MSFKYLAVLVLVAFTHAQEDDYYYDDAPRPVRPAPPRVQPGYSGPSAPKVAPIAILKQINKHNEDGSYTYGYESADGTFKIETKLPTGEVKGKYGYVDDTGKVRVVEYGATKYGFDPSGEGITVPPPTLVEENPQEEEEYNQRPAAPRNYPAAPRPRPQVQRQQQFEEYSPPQQFEPAPAPAPQRPRVPGAIPAPLQSQTFDFGPPAPRPGKSFGPAPKPRPLPAQFARPVPIEDDYEPAPAPRPAPRISYAQPAPHPRPAPRAPLPLSAEPRPVPSFAPRPRPTVPKASGSGGILDQLSRDYALPDGGAAPLHDISFGYY